MVILSNCYLVFSWRYSVELKWPDITVGSHQGLTRFIFLFSEHKRNARCAYFLDCFCRISTTGPQKNWELLRQKFKSSSKNKPIEVPLSRHGSQGRSKRHRQQQQRQLSTESQNVSTNASVPTSMGSSSGNAISVEINMPHGRSLRAQPERDDSVEHQMEEPGTSVVSFRPQRLQMFTLGSSMESNNSGLSVKSDPIIKLAPKLSEDEESPTYKSPRESPVGSISSDMSRGKVHFQREMKPNRNFKSMRNSMKKPSRRMIKRFAAN